MSEAVVEKVEALFKDQSGEAFWFLVKLKGDENNYALHRNWFLIEGPKPELKELKEGDRVEYVLSKAQLGKDGSHGIDRKGYLLFDKLTKIKEEEKL